MKPSDDAKHKTETSVRELTRDEAQVADEQEQEREPEVTEDARVMDEGEWEEVAEDATG